MEVEAVVTDVDGVLVDTSRSYHRAIIETVRTVYGETIDRADIQQFKDAGGLNNDWRTTEAIALYILARRDGYPSSIPTFTDEIATRGGGIDAALESLEETLPQATFDAIEDAWDPVGLRRTFQWLYLGPDRYSEFEDDPPPQSIPETGGFLDDEPVIIDRETRTALADYALGVLTGRPRTEAEIVLDRLDLALPSDRIVTMDDWHEAKPDPTGLVRIATACDADRVVYVGDELDDMRTAVRAEDADQDRRYDGVAVLTGGLEGKEGRAALTSAGASAILDSINALPGYLRRDASR